MLYVANIAQLHVACQEKLEIYFWLSIFCLTFDKISSTLTQMAQDHIPAVDPTVRNVGASYLRSLSTDVLRVLAETLVIQDSSGERLAVILPYKTFLAMQAKSTSEREVKNE